MTSARWCASTSRSWPSRTAAARAASTASAAATLYDDLFEPATWNRAIDVALAQALVNLESVAAPAGEMTVVLGPGWPGVLLHEAVGHGLEGDFNRKGTSAFSGRIGERVAAPGVTVIDDGAIGDRRGSLTIDDEGTPTQRNVLIEDGILKGYIQDRLNARLMGVAPTGNGRRESFAHAPMPRMTNTFMLGGKDDPGEILARAKNGIYARSFGGGQVDITSGKFVFSCTEAYRIENGRLGRADQGRDPDRRRPDRADQGGGDRRRHGIGRRRRHLRQGRPDRPRRRRPADAADRGPHRGRHRRVTLRQGSGQDEAWVRAVLDFWFSHGWDDWWRRTRPSISRSGTASSSSGRGSARTCPSIFSAPPTSALAAILLFDQFPRNMFRGHADQFSTDPLALAVAKGAVERGYDDGMTPARRGFLYMPFQHSEDLRDQRQSLLLFTALGDPEHARNMRGCIMR